MSDQVKIVSLDLENVKRIHAVHIEPKEEGLTTIGGDNAQGKTSILDGIMFALGGEKFRPTNLQRDGSIAPAAIKLVLSNGLIVERSGKNASLKVTDPKGLKGGQKLLDSFVDELALDLPKFLAMDDKKKAGVLLKILGVEKELAKLDAEESKAAEERTLLGREVVKARSHAESLPVHSDVPGLPVSAMEIMEEINARIQRNAERASKRNELANLERALKLAYDNQSDANAFVQEAQRKLDEAMKYALICEDEVLKQTVLVENAKSVDIVQDEDVSDCNQKIAELEQLNVKIRQNLDHAKAIEDMGIAATEYAKAECKVNLVREQRKALLDGATMPLENLTVIDGLLHYKGHAWDCMSSSEQVKVAVSIVRKLKPECGFVLLDKLETFDGKQLKELGKWLEEQGLQAIATRVSTGSECSIIIENGCVANDDSY